MHSLISFKRFRDKPLSEQKELQKIDYYDWDGYSQYDEDLSGSEKRKKLVLLKKLLTNFDKYYHYSDDPRAYRKGKEQQDEIEKLVKELGRDGKKMYKKFWEQNEGNKKDDDKKRTKKEKDEDDEIVNVRPKVKLSTEHYMDSNRWFPETKNVQSTGSLNRCDTEHNSLPLGISYMSDGGNLSFHSPKFVHPSEKHIKDLHRQRNI